MTLSRGEASVFSLSMAGTLFSLRNPGSYLLSKCKKTVDMGNGRIRQFERDAVSYGEGLSNFLLIFTIGEDVNGMSFQGADEELLRRALSILESQGKCAIFKGETSEEDGLKFF
eukprot:CCRYP_013385-RH/>CCRYP_013385-RH protein AED:0.27 eAED:0.27 QI:302/0.66/1/1/1/0.75/4/1666/113